MQGTQILFYLIFCSGLTTIRHHDEEDLLPRHIVSTTRSGTFLSRNARGREHGRLGDPNRSCSLRNGRVASDVFSWQGFDTTSAENWDDIFGMTVATGCAAIFSFWILTLNLISTLGSRGNTQCCVRSRLYPSLDRG